MADQKKKNPSRTDAKTSKKKEGRRYRKAKNQKTKVNTRQIVEAVSYTILALTIICIAFLGRQPMGPQILLNQPAAERIVAEFPFSYTSEILSERQAIAVRAQIPPVFKRSDLPFLEFSESISELQDEIVRVLIEFEDEGKEQLQVELEKTINEWLRATEIPADARTIYELTDRTSSKERAELFKKALQALSLLYDDGIYAAQSKDTNTKNVAVIQILNEANDGNLPNARSLSEAEIALRREIDSLSRNDKTARTLFDIFSAGLSSNLVYSESDTTIAINRAVEKITPPTFSYKEGDTLIEPAAIVDELDLERMKKYAEFALETDNDPLLFNTLFFKRFIFSLFLLTAIGLFLKRGLRDRVKRTRTLAIGAVCLLINLLIIRMVLELGELIAMNNRGVLSILPYVAPCALAPILVAALIGIVPAIFTALVISMLFGITQASSIELMLITFLSGAVGAYFSTDIRTRTELVRAGIFAGIAAALAAVLNGSLNDFSLGLITEQLLIAFVIGLLSGIVSVGLLPLLENLFKATTDITLLELTDFNHPLLRRMQIEAPGTYHHSLMVANLAENAAATIGASPLLCRVCCLFHDIGKLVKPEYFAENQRGGLNPHDEKNPSMSALVIKAHVKEGVELARNYKLPNVIIDVIRQHHGTSLIQYFYYQARERLKDNPNQLNLDNGSRQKVDESTYRYDGPCPAFKESAIIFFADGVEAASRSLPKVTQSNIEDLIDKIFRDRIEDGQLNDCPLTFQELNKIRKSFVYTLLNMLHSRIEYPKEEGQTKGA